MHLPDPLPHGRGSDRDSGSHGQLKGWSYLAAFIVSSIVAPPGFGQEARQQLFERVFGDAVKLDPDMVAKTRAAEPGERIFVDRDGDGANDEAWYIDTALRHTDEKRPILVRAIDEDGDLDEYLGPDLDSDLYVADWHADGTVDVVLDYQDNDGDDDVDEMAFYFYMPHHRYFGDDVLRVWWGQDDGDDNLLWYDVDYTYYQGLCQYRCHFSGEESFVAFGLMPGRDEWVSAFENPFLFYDPDDDKCSEVVLRIEGHDDEVRAVRYSFDVDDDAYDRRTHDYDFSITTRAPEDAPIKLPDNLVKGMKLRGLPTQAWLQREHARQFVENADWQVAVLTWDEMNANTEVNVERDPNERWEGIIAHPSEHFKQVGGPPCSPLNKRNEVALQPFSPMTLYYHPADRRLHLKGADEGWLHVDYDFDGKIDAKYTWLDEDNDGFFDRRKLDLDADGEIDFDWPMKSDGIREFALDQAALTEFYKAELERVLVDSQAYIDAVHAAAAADFDDRTVTTEFLRLPIPAFFLNDLASWMPATRLGEQIRQTPAGARLYIDLLRDSSWIMPGLNSDGDGAWRRVESVYATGDYAKAAEILRRELVPSNTTLNAKAFKNFTSRIPLHIGHEVQRPRIDQPLSLSIRDIRRRASDFNAANCAVVAPERWLDWRQIPHQLDMILAETNPKISFLVDLDPEADATYWLYYAPEGSREHDFTRKTGTAEDWVPPNIGWESNRCAYRAYWGQFDFFGKKTDQLIYDGIGATSYHDETEWGIDALHVGKTSGLGGLTLYVDDKPYLVQNPAGEGDVQFTKRVLTQGPVRAAIEITAGNIVPDRPGIKLQMVCTIYAERQESEIQVRVTNAADDVTLAPGIVKLPREQWFAEPDKGCFGSWGWQEFAIGDIGMGVIVDPKRVVDVKDLPDERRIRCRLDDNGELRYWIIGDWRRGRQHPVAPTIDNWRWELHQLAAELLNPPAIEIGPAERVERAP